MRTIALTLLAFALSGCANLFSIYRPLAVEGRSVSVDAKQRVVASQPDAERKLFLLCAEPSPDALSSYGTGAGGTLRIESEAQLQTALALVEQTAAIGLRTQSIQLLRDAMYRTCEAYFSGGLKNEQPYMLLRRFQNIMLGLLAIEQLTGAVKAQQVILNNSTISATGASVESESTALIDAREKLAKLEKELEDERRELGTREKTVQAAETKKENAEKALQDAEEGEKEAKEDALNKANEDLAHAERAQNEQDSVVRLKEKSVEIAKGAVKIAEENLADARARVRASASGEGQLGWVPGPSGTVAAATAKAVERIVQEVLTQGGMLESCALAVTPLMSSPGTVSQAVELLKQCANLQQQETEMLKVKLNVTSGLQRGQP